MGSRGDIGQIDTGIKGSGGRLEIGGLWSDTPKKRKKRADGTKMTKPSTAARKAKRRKKRKAAKHG